MTRPHYDWRLIAAVTHVLRDKYPKRRLMHITADLGLCYQTVKNSRVKFKHTPPDEQIIYRIKAERIIECTTDLSTIFH